MQQLREQAGGYEAVQDLLEQSVLNRDLGIPSLPQVAVRVVRAGPKNATNAHQLADIISVDPTLTLYVLRIVSSAAKRAASPIASLQHAVAWLGFDEVANIAFTLALQGEMLDVPGQQRRARGLWRHALASALWSRQLAHLLACETGICYLCGLLHDIGKLVALRAAHEVANRTGVQLADDDYDHLVEVFHRPVGAQVIAAWKLPPPVLAAASHWETYASAGAARFESNVVHVAHRLADFTLFQSTHLERDALLRDAAFRDLGLNVDHGEPLFESASAVNAELDRYLSP
jgi:HD-like signal output (HDOD) protein